MSIYQGTREYTAEEIKALAEDKACSEAVAAERKRCVWIISQFGLNTGVSHSLVESGKTPETIASEALAGVGPMPLKLTGQVLPQPTNAEPVGRM